MTQTTDRLAEVLHQMATFQDGNAQDHTISLINELADLAQSLSTDLDKAQQRIAELEAALAASKQGWDNVLEFRLIADNHRTTARALSDEAFATLNQSKESGNEG